MAEVYKDAADIIAHLDGVTAAVVEAAGPIRNRARALLKEHEKTGEHEVNLRLGERTDAFVDLTGPGAAALEEGWVTKTGKAVDGIHVLKRAVGE